MGCYVNPKNETKEDWLQNNANTIYVYNEFPTWEKVVVMNCLPVILVDNGFFTAAAVAYSKQEYEEFTREDDSRGRQVYIVPIDKLKEVSPLEEYLK